ncbi:MAG: creatininase family protein, partial [Ferruginibacter sp.]|nr:creatininase family protein [Ferruginibacter sp.]
MKPYILAETNWKYVKDAVYDVAVLPWGATEAHNYHLPYATDNIEATAIASEAARIAWDKGAKIIVLPTIPFGVNTGQADIKLDINIYPSTQQAILSDIIEVLNRQKIYKLLIVNSHGGNDFKQIIRELGLKFPDMFLSTCNWFQSLDKTRYFKEMGDHADEMETSLIMHLAPHLVLPLQEAGKGKAKKPVIKEFSEGWAWAERKWSQVTEDTGIGDPSFSTKEKGVHFFEAVTHKLADLMYALAKADKLAFPELKVFITLHLGYYYFNRLRRKGIG